MPVVIAGAVPVQSLNMHQRACEVYIEAEQAKILPDTHLIALLCDSVRLVRENTALHAECLALAGRLIEAKMEIERLRHSCAPLVR
jgi:hypothetical protein